MKVLLLVLLSITVQAQSYFEFPAELVRTIDGDTYDLLVTVPDWDDNFKDFKKIKLRVRLKNIDTYEMKKCDQDLPLDCEKQHELAVRGKDYSDFMLTLRPFYIRYSDKYYDSRWVADIIFKDGSYLKDELKAKGYTTGKYEK
jgi:endonuclease YncB( thermonuclease family)